MKPCEDDAIKQNHMKAMPKNTQNCTKAMPRTKQRAREGDTNKQIVSVMESREVGKTNHTKPVKRARVQQDILFYYSSPSLIGSFFTINPMRVSSSKIISHLLRCIPVEGMYCLSINDHLMRGKITPRASAKICTALFFMEPAPQPFGGADDGPKISPTKAPLLGRELPSPILCEPWSFMRERDATSPHRLCPETVEAPSGPASSNRSISSQSSPMLTLYDPLGAAPAPSS
jgi:hypothetical protein